MICDIRIILIHPVTHARSKFAPEIYVFPDAFFAFFVEFIYTVFLYAFFYIHPYLFLHLYLHRKPVRIPAAFSPNMVPAHSLVSWYRVLESSSFQVVNTGLAVCRRRPFVENEFSFGRFLL